MLKFKLWLDRKEIQEQLQTKNITKREAHYTCHDKKTKKNTGKYWKKS